MYIHRDITTHLTQVSSWVQILMGPRQCGKSTLFAAAARDANAAPFQEITFDDFRMRQLANGDPALFLQQFEPPLLLDEVQYVPNLFSEIKKIVDLQKRAATFASHPEQTKMLFRLTGSNQILMDKNIKESLAGRASYFYLNTLTVHEILKALPQMNVKEILFKGGWPELYRNGQLSAVTYLNDYIRTYVEKDILTSGGVQKANEFHTVLRLLGARTGQETKYTELSNNCGGVTSSTVKDWVSLLERADLVYLLRPYFTNLSSRLIKTPKLYFLDTGLATRLQGWSDATPLMSSPHIGALFETLVLAEIVKFIRNYSKDWELFFWRTKDGEEIDFIIKTERGAVHAFESKLSVNGMPHAVSYPPAFKKHFSPLQPLTVVTYGGRKLQIAPNCVVLPIAELHDTLLQI
jgi:predicted AAA+ superfamily ATPase